MWSKKCDSVCGFLDWNERNRNVCSGLPFGWLSSCAFQTVDICLSVSLFCNTSHFAPLHCSFAYFRSSRLAFMLVWDPCVRFAALQLSVPSLTRKRTFSWRDSRSQYCVWLAYRYKIIFNTSFVLRWLSHMRRMKQKWNESTRRIRYRLVGWARFEISLRTQAQKHNRHHVAHMCCHLNILNRSDDYSRTLVYGNLGHGTS